MAEKKTFILYTDYLEKFAGLSEAQLGQLFKSILIYQSGGEIKIDDPVTKLAWAVVKTDMDKENKKWEETKKIRSEAGKKAVNTRWEKQRQLEEQDDTNVYERIRPNTNVSKNTNSESVSVSDSDSDNTKSSNEDFNNLATADAVAELSENFESEENDQQFGYLDQRVKHKGKEKSVNQVLAEKYGFTGQKKQGGATYEWQDYAVRYAQGLQIKLTGKDKASWFKMFKNAYQNNKKALFERAYAYLFDSPTWEKYDNPHKIKCIQFIYHHGLDAFKTKGGFYAVA